MDGALEERAAKNARNGGELGSQLISLAEWPAIVSSIMMIHHFDCCVNTFFK
jgi:hypothetical protein